MAASLTDRIARSTTDLQHALVDLRHRLLEGPDHADDVTGVMDHFDETVGSLADQLAAIAAAADTGVGLGWDEEDEEEQDEDDWYDDHDIDEEIAGIEADVRDLGRRRG